MSFAISLQSNVFEFPSSCVGFRRVDFQLLIVLVIQNERKRPRAEGVGAYRRRRS